MTRVKLCGLSEPEHAVAAARAGADFVGMVFAESRRRVSIEQARAISEAVREIRPVPSARQEGAVRAAPEVERGIDGLRPALVGVFAGHSAEEVNRIAEVCGLDFVQLAGEEPWEFVEHVERPVLYGRHVGPADDTTSLRRRLPADLAPFARLVPILHLDTGGFGVSGGTGVVFPWQVAADLSREVPLVLAGGLTPENVAEAIRRVRPWCVDVSSGVETNGVKDPEKIRRFVSAVRQQDAGQEGAVVVEKSG